MMYQKGLLLGSLQKLLGRYQEHKNDETVFYCPFCNHHKMKFVVNLRTQKWHCWVCNAKGRALFHLLKRVNASKSQISEILTLIGDLKFNIADGKQNESLALPKEFKPLWEESSELLYKHSINYLSKRGIGRVDILRYGIGYCDSGSYVNRVIIPSYDSFGKLNYFVARDIFPNSKLKYKNPSVSKDTVIFELFVNWRRSVVLCEGVFDSIAIRLNAIPLLGKFPSNSLIKKILENKVKEIYVALDRDAKIDSIKLVDKLLGYGIKVHRLDMKGNDPSDLGFKGFWELADKSREVKFSDIVRDRLYG